MKTFNYISALTTAIVLMISLSLSATSFDFTDEKYIDDIPFSTEEVFNSINIPPAMEINFDFPEEEYVDDIPFNTECITKKCLFEAAIAEDFDFEDEHYIDDIDLPLQ